MINMIILTNKKHKAFYKMGDEEWAKQDRRTDPRLKYARLGYALQAYPGQVECGKVYDR